MHQGHIPCKQGMVPCELHYAVNSGGKHASGIHTLQAGNSRLHQGYIPCKQGMVDCELHYVQYAVNSGGKRASGIHTLQAGHGTLRIALCGKLRGETCISDTYPASRAWYTVNCTMRY